MNRSELLDKLAMDSQPTGKWGCITQAGYTFSRHEIESRRAELINCPPDSEAPSEVARYRSQDANGEWWWHELNPFVVDTHQVWDSDGWQALACKGAIPSGHDWRATLTEVKHMEQPYQADARRLDAQLAADMKQPRYQDVTGEDWIDEFARTATVDEFRGAMRFTIGKYNRRVGKKDDVLKEVVKMRDYCQRWEEYERELLK